MHSFYRVSALGLYAAAAVRIATVPAEQTPAEQIPAQCSIPLVNVPVNPNPEPWRSRFVIPLKRTAPMPRVRVPAPPCRDWESVKETRKLK